MARARVQAMILGGGLGTRMKSAVPKVLHDVLGHPMVWYVVEAVRGLDASPVLVTPPGNDVFREFFGASVLYAEQPQRLGSGHAVQCGMGSVTAEYVLICNGDNPLPSSEDYEEFVDACLSEGATAGVLSADLADPRSLGRIVRDERGSFIRIVETRDATPAELAVREVNTGIYFFRTEELRRWLAELRPENAQGEYYITDCLSMAMRDGAGVSCHQSRGRWELVGINDRSELAAATKLLQARKQEALFAAGVTIDLPDTVRVDWDVTVEADSEIRQGSCLRGATRVGRTCIIGPNTTLLDASVDDGAQVVASYVEASHIGSGCVVGPFSYIRPGTTTGKQSKVGAFCELKATTLGMGSKVPHLSYIGDATVGENVNIGAGTITCNYDGFTSEKHRTVIEKDAFIGANNNLVAPVTVHEGAYTATGSTITHDVPPGSLGIARAVQVDKDGWVRRKKHGQ